MSKLTDYSKFDHLTEDDSDNDSDNDRKLAVEENDKSTAEMAAAASPSPSLPPGVSRIADNKHGATARPSLGAAIRRDETSGRYRFEYNGRIVYEFEQSLDEMTIYILPPPYVTRGNQIDCRISANHFKLGLVGHSVGNSGGNKDNQRQWFLNEATGGTVDVDESTWTLEDYDGDGNHKGVTRRKIIVVTLIKANRGSAWEAALKGNPNPSAGGRTAHATGTGTQSSSCGTTMDPFSKEQVKKDLMLQRFNEENPGFDFSGADFNGSVPDAREFMGGIKYQ